MYFISRVRVCVIFVLVTGREESFQWTEIAFGPAMVTADRCGEEKGNNTPETLSPALDSTCRKRRSPEEGEPNGGCNGAGRYPSYRLTREASSC